jgi:hypothetical protein
MYRTHREKAAQEESKNMLRLLSGLIVKKVQDAENNVNPDEE